MKTIDSTEEAIYLAFLQGYAEATVEQQQQPAQYVSEALEGYKPQLLRWFESADDPETGDISMVSMDAITSVTRHIEGGITIYTNKSGVEWYSEDPDTISRFWDRWEVI